MERFEARMRSNNPIASPPADSQQASTHHPSTSQAATWNPELRRTLTLLGLDVHFHRAQGAYLYYRDSGGRERRVIDLISGYGSVLLGHHPPALIARARQFLDQGEAFFCQGSRPEATCELADELSRRCGGDFHVCFSSTGSGAVEIAIQHAILETGRHKIMALQGAFHGRTIGTGALSACVSSAYARGRFDVVRVPRDDPVAIAQAFSTHQSSEGPDGLAACIFEPILGEGGVRPLSAEVLETLQRGCRDQDIPLIADECQTGMGRTGSFLASTQAGCSPDYIILSKALGGGMAKVSACLIRRQRYRPEFDWQHTSTFAADPFSSAIALKALEALSESTLQRVRHAGREVLARLTELREQFPDVIADVRGAGLMLAVQLRRQALSQSLLMRIVNQHEIAGHAVAAYLFHQHQVRVAPTLSDPWTLRIHGTLETSREDWGRLLDGLEDVCSLLANQDMATLLQVATKKRTVESDRSIALGKSWIPFNRGDCLREEVTQRQHALKRVGWICHLIDDQDVADHDESFAMLPCAERERLLQSLLPLAKPIVMSAPVIQSTTGQQLQLIPIMLPVTSRMFRQWLDSGNLARGKSLVADAIDVARSLGCELVSLGQYTSMVTRNGRSLADIPIGLTTGNAFAAALSVQAVYRLVNQYAPNACSGEQGGDPSRLTLALVGGSGNIGRVLAQSLAPAFARTLLCASDRPNSLARLNRMAEKVPRCTVTADLNDFRKADVIVSSVNVPAPILDSRHIRAGAIVCDVSVPGSVCPDAAQREDIHLIRGGIVQLPGKERLDIANFPLDDGTTYACMAEALLLGFEQQINKRFTGALSLTHLREVQRYAHKHGFELADYKRHCVFGTNSPEPASWH